MVTKPTPTTAGGNAKDGGDKPDELAALTYHDVAKASRKDLARWCKLAGFKTEGPRALLALRIFRRGVRCTYCQGGRLRPKGGMEYYDPHEERLVVHLKCGECGCRPYPSTIESKQ